ncbi:tyrosine-type recombinase/integrase [Fundidesulfovibrio soli]|uniref:tyrosine-type recombinase/integrase n=1 Tax=Fundidesulfovibrio soli TaxID=2922716 RepID=UPI001FAFA477|nr:tyrosine-type recombinase/integrase [Fundidesulfovibrio soli]
MVLRLKKVLLAWWEHRPIKSDHVFVNIEEYAFCKDYLGEPFTNRQHFMERLCEKAEVKTFGFHAIRHLTASLLYREGQPVAVVQAVLRHKSPQTTTRYLQSLGLKQTQEAMEAVMGQRGPGKISRISARTGKENM